MTAATARLVLDTSVLLHIVRGSSTGIAMDSTLGLRTRTDRPLVSIVSVGEVEAFTRRNNWGQPKRKRLLELLGELIIVDIRRGPIVEWFAQIHVWLQERGRTLSHNDTWIAATAAALDATVITNDGDFAPLVDLPLGVRLFPLSPKAP
jgi:tRNA(fMet)-specific endonuclease VapC